MKRVIVMKTNIQSPGEVEQVASSLNQCEAVKKWTVDTDDIDKVLRIEASGHLNEQEVQNLLTSLGFLCEDLPD